MLTGMAIVLFLFGAAACEYGRDVFLKSHGIYFERHTQGCLPWLFYFADKDVRTVSRGDIVLFSSRGAAPLFKDGSPLVKMAIGVPGDTIVAEGDKLYVNGTYWGSTKLGLLHFSKPPGYWDRKVMLKEGEYFMLGTEPRSFDSRFWGVVKREQIRATLYLLF